MCAALPLTLHVYVSSAVVPLSDTELNDLLETSRRNNTVDGITGLLLYADGCFLQAFEGPSDAVQRLKSTLHRDPRHRGILPMLTKQIDQRLFDDWTMGFERITKDRFVEVEGLNDYLQTGTLGPDFDHRPVMLLLENFRRINSRAA